MDRVTNSGKRKVRGGGQYISLATASIISCDLQCSYNGESYVSPLDTVESWPWLGILTSPLIADLYFQLGKYAVSQIGAGVVAYMTVGILRWHSSENVRAAHCSMTLVTLIDTLFPLNVLYFLTASDSTLPCGLGHLTAPSIPR